jgi:hypothetical protein
VALTVDQLVCICFTMGHGVPYRRATRLLEKQADRVGLEDALVRVDRDAVVRDGLSKGGIVAVGER